MVGLLVLLCYFQLQILYFYFYSYQKIDANKPVNMGFSTISRGGLYHPYIRFYNSRVKKSTHYYIVSCVINEYEAN